MLYSHAMALSMKTLIPGDDIRRFYAISPHGALSLVELLDSILNRSLRVITAQALTIDFILEVLKKHDVNVLFVLPFNAAALADRMLAETYDLPMLTMILSGGSSVSEATRSKLSKALPNVEIVHKYGMSEVGSIASSNSTIQNDSVGYLVPGMSAKVRIAGPKNRR